MFHPIYGGAVVTVRSAVAYFNNSYSNNVGTISRL